MASTNDKQNFVYSLRSMVNQQKILLFEEFEKEQAIARVEFEKAVERTLSVKEKQLNVFARQLEMSDEPLDRQKLAQCKRVQSLMCLKYKQGRSITAGSLRSAGYIQSCKASPQDLFFVDDYRLSKFKKGDCHRVYYECYGSYDPCLIGFLAVAVRDESNKELNASNRDLMSGVYLMEFVTGEEGMYSVHVTLYGQHISGSPLHIQVCSDSVKEESKPTGLGRDQRECGDGPSQTGLPPRAVTREPSREMSQRYEMWADAHGRCPEQPAVRPATQAGNLEAPPQRHELPEAPPRVHPKPNNLGTSVNASPKAVFPQEQTVLGFSTAPTVAGHMSAPKPFEQNVSSDAGLNLKAPGAGPREVPDVKRTSAPNDFCSQECFESKERNKVSHRSSFSSSTSVMQCSAPPVESTRKACPPKPSSQPAAKAPAKKGFFRADLVFEFRGFRWKKFCYPIGVTATAHNVIIVADTGNDDVVMFDYEANALCRVSLPDALGGFKRPSAVVAQQDGTFAVKDDKCIYVFSRKGEFIRTLGRGVLSRPYGLALEGDENLLTLSLGESPPSLRTYSMSGGFHKANSYGPLLPCAPHNSKCRFMDVCGDDLFVSDLGLSSIYKTTLQGETVKIFGGPGKTPGLLNEPAGLSTTQDYLFVGDSKNNRIQVFDLDGNFISVVKMKAPLERPSGLYVSPQNTLYVLNYFHATAGVYQLTFREQS